MGTKAFASGAPNPGSMTLRWRLCVSPTEGIVLTSLINEIISLTIDCAEPFPHNTRMDYGAFAVFWVRIASGLVNVLKGFGVGYQK